MIIDGCEIEIKAIFSVFAIAVIFYIISFIMSKRKNIEDHYMYFVMKILEGIALGTVIVVLLIAFTTSTKIEKDTNVKEQKLISMKFNNRVSGEFLLGTGSVNNTDYLVYYTKNGKEIVRNKKEAKDIKIIEDKSEPKIIITTIEKTKKINCFFGEDIKKYNEPPIIEFHIQAKSIIENIQLN